VVSAPCQTLQDFIGIHAGQTAWLFGKGPSLSQDSIDAAISAGGILCAINETAGIIPGVQYGFANDDVAPWVNIYSRLSPSFRLFQPRRTSLSGAIPECRRISFDDSADIDATQATPTELSFKLQIGPGTLSSVIQILWIMGFSRVICVGIDGGQERSTIAEWQSDPARANHYNEIRSWASRLAHFLNFPLLHFSTDRTLTHSEMKIQVTRNVFSNGTPLQAGETVELSDADAQELIGMGAAIMVPSAKTITLEDVVKTEKTEAATEPAKKTARKATAKK
jgi:hypothetical protein